MVSPDIELTLAGQHYVPRLKKKCGSSYKTNMMQDVLRKLGTELSPIIHRSRV